jgi:endonuclease/exonuclease/phosphatase (EEP) superfamily protein YafD
MLARDAEVIGYFEEHFTGCNGILDDASDCLASKGFQVLRVRLGGEELDLYNTHHEAGGGDADNAAREAQVQEVIDSIADRSEGRAVLFMGDTNLRWSDPEDVAGLQLYAEAGLLDACDLVDCPETDHIDRFLMRDSDTLTITATRWWRDKRFVDADADDLSDHPAIAATFDWAVRQ